MTLLPLSVVDWQEAIRYLVLDKVRVVEWHDDWVVRSVSWSTKVPAVMMLKEYQKPKSTMRLSKRNIFLRDGYKCQYCGIQVNESTATVDHVLPTSLGGKTSWENCTTSCKSCNHEKGATKADPTTKPYRPSFWELVQRRRERGFHLHHPSWANYIGCGD